MVFSTPTNLRTDFFPNEFSEKTNLENHMLILACLEAYSSRIQTYVNTSSK